ncbi:MAG: response regulator transcription factor [Candidatus Kapaibacterium sp.]
MKRVAIVDDHLILLNLVSDYLKRNSEYEVAGTFKSGNELLFANRREEVDIDIVLLDLFMEDGDGFLVVEELKKLNPLIKIVIMTFNKQPGLLESVLKSGADGIINKASEDVEILNALKDVEKGNIFLCPITSSIINNKRDKVRELNQINALTPREREILYLICNDELTNNQIADKLHISEKTVKTHRKNIYHKLNVNTTIQLVRAAINLAYISVVD